MPEFDESLFDDGYVVARSEDAHGGWLERRSYGVSVPGIEGAESPQWTIVESFRRRRDAEMFLAGMRAGWRHGLALSAKREALRKYIDERRAAVGEQSAVDVSLHCRSCDVWSRHWMTEDNLDELAGQRDAAGLAPVSRRCVGGHLKLPAGGQWVPNDGHYGVWSARREVFDDDAPGPGGRGRCDPRG